MKQRLRLCVGCVLAVLLLGCGRPELSEESAERVLPDGMSVQEVTNLLGAPISVQSNPDGSAFYWYMFGFVEDPPGVRPKPKALSITVVVSNGVVCGRSCGQTR